MKREENYFYLIYFICCIFIFLRLEIALGSDFEAPFTDDFYYYLTTSRNLIDLSFLSFDKLSLTNGFQPLWFLIITLFNSIFLNDILMNTSIIITIFILSFLSFFNFKNYFTKINYLEKESIFISSGISFLSLFFSKNGMEISLSIFLFSFSLKFIENRIILFSIFAFLTFLSRLEFIIFYFVILFDEVIFKKKILDIKYILKLSLLPILILFYMVLNYKYFGFIFPESGVAKSLYKELKFNIETFNFLNSESLGMKFISLMFYLNLISLFFLFSDKISKFSKYSIITNIIFFSSNSLRSAWPLWTWHFFFLAISTPLILNDFVKLIKFHRLNFLTILLCLFFLTSYSYLFYNNLGVKNDHILNIAKKISIYYKNTNYDKFAMGDMAGKVSYLLDKKLIQLEGLVGGKKVIQNIKAESNLCDVLKEFEVDIYLSSKVKMEGGYYYTNEPSQSSNNVKKMKGIFKIDPDNIFKSGTIEIYSFNVNKIKNCNKLS